jgi:hypothetical protein
VAELVCAAAQGADLLDPAVTADEVLHGWTTTHGTWVHVLDGTATPPYNVVEQSFGFAPTVRVAFSRGTADHRDLDQQDDIVRLVAALLDALPGDAVLMFLESDEAWLLRRGADLSVSEIDDRWPPHRQALLPRPCRRASHSLLA